MVPPYDKLSSAIVTCSSILQMVDSQTMLIAACDNLCAVTWYFDHW